LSDATTFKSLVEGALLLLVFFVPLHWIAWRRGFFHLDHSQINLWQKKARVGGLHVAFGFFVWFGVLLFSGVLISLASHFSQSDGKSTLSSSTLNLLGLLIAPLQLLALLIIVRRIPGLWTYLFPTPRSGFLKNLLSQYIKAFFSYILALPAISLLALLVGALLFYFTGFQDAEQEVVKQVQSFAKDPPLFAAALVVVVLIAPICEEILFRGLLLTWLCKKLPIRWALILSAILFAVLHMNAKQGWGNIQIVLSIGLLGVYLGHLFLRQKTLWASIGLHMIFNGVSAVVILLKEV
jgi:membrane protease YdiL (CAAX protease family)